MADETAKFRTFSGPRRRPALSEGWGRRISYHHLCPRPRPKSPSSAPLLPPQTQISLRRSRTSERSSTALRCLGPAPIGPGRSWPIGRERGNFSCKMAKDSRDIATISDMIMMCSMSVFTGELIKSNSMGGCDMSCTHTCSCAYLFILEEHRTYGGYLLNDNVVPCFDRRASGIFQPFFSIYILCTVHVYLER